MGLVFIVICILKYFQEETLGFQEEDYVKVWTSKKEKHKIISSLNINLDDTNAFSKHCTLG